MDLQNHYYGHSVVLARHCGLPRPRHIAGLLQHGWTPTSPLLYHFADFPRLPARHRYLVWSHRSRGWDPLDDRPSVAIGAPWLYMPPPRTTPVATPGERRVVVFPAHGTKVVRMTGDHAAFAAQVAAEYGPAVVSLHDDDAGHREAAAIWAARGHVPVSAGQRRDPRFMCRIRSLISGADLVIANRLSTSVLYAAVLGVPVRITGPAFGLLLGTGVDAQGALHHQLRRTWPEFYDDSATLDDHRQVAARELGADAVREPTELAELLGWGGRNPRPFLQYWVGGPLHKAGNVLGVSHRMDDGMSLVSGASPLTWLRHPASHLPARLPDRRPTLSTGEDDAPLLLPVGAGTA